MKIGWYLKFIGSMFSILLIITSIYLIVISNASFFWVLLLWVILIIFPLFQFGVSSDGIDHWFHKRKQNRISRILEEEYKKKAKQIESFIEDYNRKRV